MAPMIAAKRFSCAAVVLLLAEVKALRAEVNQAAGASVRMQLLVARLSLQEQRIGAVARQLSEAQVQLRTVEQEKSTLDEKARDMEQVIAHVRSQGRDTGSAEAMRDQMKSDMLVRARDEQQLQLQITELQGALAQEQGRWADFNNRLDDLERSLPVPR